MDWKKEDLESIAATDDLHVAPFREDGKTIGTPTWVWSVVVDDGLYVRAYSGEGSRWYQAAVREGAGQITAAGKTHDVAFTPAEQSRNDSVDAAYRGKYSGSPYLSPMIGAKACATTLKVTPRAAG